MLKTLSEANLATYTPYEGARLTDAGQRLAMKVIRRHRLLELFLARTLEMSWDEVHEEAEHMEHAASERLIDRIEAFLGYPAVDPHGDPIPRADGSLTEPEGTPLSQCPGGQRFSVVRVMDQDPAFLRYLSECGLDLHATGLIVENRPESGAVVCRLGGRSVALGLAAAAKVLVQRGQASDARSALRAKRVVGRVRVRDRGGRVTGRAGGLGPGRGRPRARRSPGRAASPRACGRWRRSGCDSRGRGRCRACVSMLPGRRPAQVASTSAWARTGQSRSASSSRSRTAAGGGPGVEAGVLLGRADQDPAVLARHQVVLAVLDDPAQQGAVVPEQHDLALERRRRGVDAEPPSRSPDQAPAATITQPQQSLPRRGPHRRRPGRPGPPADRPVARARA